MPELDDLRAVQSAASPSLCVSQQWSLKPADEHVERPARQCPSREIPFVVRVDEPKGRLRENFHRMEERWFTHCRTRCTSTSTALLPPSSGPRTSAWVRPPPH